MVENAYVQFVRASLRQDVEAMVHWYYRCEEHGWNRYFEFLEAVLTQAVYRRFRSIQDPAPIRQFAQYMKALTDSFGLSVELEVIESVLLAAGRMPIKPSGDRDTRAKVTELVAIRLLFEENLPDRALTAILANADHFENLLDILSQVERK